MLCELVEAGLPACQRPQQCHGYDTISSSIIWAIAIRELPQLREDVAALLTQQTE
ncbi:hypothetical protein [Candidatus Electronema sp. JM]|uniref:hypothetical protein n=1 Tax=Candidatus Electronema sp. JM TaxID=3401571 RepID=UPI003AA8458A